MLQNPHDRVLHLPEPKEGRRQGWLLISCESNSSGTLFRPSDKGGPPGVLGCINTVLGEKIRGPVLKPWTGNWAGTSGPGIRIS